MVERIPREILDRAGRRLARIVASVIIRAMAERDCSFEQLDERLGKRRGWSRKFVYKLADGNGSKGLRTLGAVAYGLGVEFVLTITPNEERADGRGDRGGESESAAAGTAAAVDDGETAD